MMKENTGRHFKQIVKIIGDIDEIPTKGIDTLKKNEVGWFEIKSSISKINNTIWHFKSRIGKLMETNSDLEDKS